MAHAMTATKWDTLRIIQLNPPHTLDQLRTQQLLIAILSDIILLTFGTRELDYCRILTYYSSKHNYRLCLYPIRLITLNWNIFIAQQLSSCL